MDPFRTLRAKAIPLDRANVDTDQIKPSRFGLPLGVSYARFMLHDLRFDASGESRPESPFEQPAYAGARILVADANFGCGSSRESAVWALRDYGFRAIIASSYGDILYGNCFKQGILPVVLSAPAVAELRGAVAAQPGIELEIDLESQTVTSPSGTRHRFEVDAFRKHCLLEGVDELVLTLRHEREILDHEARDRQARPWLLDAFDAGSNRPGVILISQRTEDSIAAANCLTSQFDVPIDHPVLLHDDTLRDGEQTAGVMFTVDQKVEICRLLLDAGIRSMVVGFPVVSEEERRAVVECFKLKRNPDVLMWCLSRATRGDIDRSIECGAKHVGIFVAVSDIHLKHKLRLDENEALARTMDVARYAAAKGLSVHVGLEDGTRAPIERVLRFFSAAAEAGAQHVGLADTVGILTPLSTYHIVSKLAKAAAPLPLSVHFHDDLGMAVANTICAAQAGARRLMGAFGGLGDRAGNACLEEVAVTLRVKFGLDLGIDYVKLANAARRAAEHARLVVPPNKPIIGENVFSHEAGIHVQGLVNDLSTYEPFPPELVGRAHEVHVGKHSGVASMRYLARVNGLHASDTVLEQALHRVKTTAQDCGRPTTAAEAIAILREQIALDDT